MISKAHACLFTKQDCKPCTETKEFLHSLYDEEPDYGLYVSELKKENHTALVCAYELDKFPTLLLVDDQGHELTRVVGGREVRKQLPGMLNTLLALG